MNIQENAVIHSIKRYRFSVWGFNNLWITFYRDLVATYGFQVVETPDHMVRLVQLLNIKLIKAHVIASR